MKPESLRCEQLVDPLAIETRQPRLSWRFNSKERGKAQSAYRVLVASSSENLKRDIGDLWDSGRVESAQSTLVTYRGAVLKSRTRAFWKVKAWDEKNLPSAWSESAAWRMGLLQPSDWLAKWIGASAEDEGDPVKKAWPAPSFRREFGSKRAISSAVVHISGLGFYDLAINGKRVGNQELAPAVTNYDKRPLRKLLYPYDDRSSQRVLYNTFDVADLLRTGQNCIAVTLGNGWYNQRDRTVEGEMWYGLPRLILQLEITYSDGTEATIVSDEHWKTSTGPILSNGIFSGEIYDARRSLGGWQKPGASEQGWTSAVLVRPPTGELHSQSAPPDRVIRTLTPRLQSTSGLVSRYVLDETVSGWAKLRVRGKAGGRVDLRFIAEEGEDYGQKDSYILAGNGAESWSPKFTWHAFRTIEITKSDPSITLERVGVEEVRTAVDSVGEFECSNPLFNRIYEAYVRTQKANVHGSISSDCPHRERLGYTGDGQVAIESALDCFDLFQFYRKWFDDMDDARNKTTGFVTHTAPFGGGGGGPAWGSAYVIMPWSFYLRYGDRSVLDRHYAGMKGWVEYLGTRTDENGLVVREEPDGWCLGDWCTPGPTEIPEPLVNTAYYYHVAETMAKVAEALGRTEDRQAFLARAQRIKSDFNRAFFDPAKGGYWQSRQGSNVLALAFGLVPDEHRKQVFESLLTHLEALNYHFDTGILATPLLLQVLSDEGRDDIAYRIMNRRDFPSFGYLLSDANSTLWESWDGHDSHAHPMFGSVVHWLTSGLGGIEVDPASPGMQHFLIEPKTVADLEYCKTSYRGLYGLLRSDWRKLEGGKIQFSIEVPVNTSARFVLPAEHGAKIRLDGREAPMEGAMQGRDGKVSIELESGRHVIEI